MKDVAGLFTCLFLAVGLVWYVPLILNRRVRPVAASWIISFLATQLAVWSYHAIPGRTILENITLYAAAVNITVVLGVVLLVLYQAGELTVEFDRVQKASLLGMTAILAYWIFHRDRADLTFWTIQTLIVLSYIPMFNRVLKMRTAFDSIGNWACAFGGTLTGFVPALAMRSPYGVVNSLRGITLCGMVLYFLLYYDRKNGMRGWRGELSDHASFWKGLF